jgi:hypothetical protein
VFSWWRECPQCGKEIFSEELTHCTSCGEELEFKICQGFICTECGEEVEDYWSFCGHCGTDLQD